MGNAALRELAVLESIPFDALAGSVLGIDAHNWLYRYLTTTVRWTDADAYTMGDGTEVPNLIGVVRGIPKFFEHDLTPIFVFDGVVTDLKEDEVEERRAAKEAAAKAAEEARAAGNPIEAARYESRTQRLTPVIQETTRELLSILDIPLVEAPAEGEAQAAYMASEGDVDAAGTEDYDALLFGAPVTIRQLTSSGDPERMELGATLERHDITHEQLVDVGLLCGTDFNPGLSGFGPKTALDAIHEYGDIFSVLDAEDREMELVHQVREMFLDPNVSDAYTIDTTINPDIDAAHTYLTSDWQIDPGEVETGLGRLEDAVQQPGLGHWT